jgi:hypothetical protein
MWKQRLTRHLELSTLANNGSVELAMHSATDKKEKPIKWGKGELLSIVAKM